ncbi:glycosyltransferase family 4 protein [Intrasporangium calvum]|uniref:D-inositol 3-phosphate glycosyltransferase n=1 Tax=Intrasporangium calvum (strain ATCC 23552 / DSM 43043 / JCM 3097 / NBRC 12989 / NCIMB 10167 / NRRL B-3866 / 7 KIP) TaxID=710696 RepID=E6SDE7_INTC7|nr:glycosyltransferase family 4 protein [Intrasporangium calvum]ADU47569.1 glycosyl transferase group 1 [Intrasporangium calvum DSM 43043]
MKVALLTDCYLPRLGGIEVQSHDLAQHLVALGHEVEVFTATPGPEGQLRGEITPVDGIPVHRLAIRLPWELPVNPLAPRELRRRLTAGGFDVAHVQTGVVSPFAWDGTRVTLDLGLPTAMTWHCMLGQVAPGFAVAGFVHRWAARGVAMSAVSGVAAAPLRELVGPAAAVTVLPNGIDVAHWRPSRSAHSTQGAAQPSSVQSPPLRLITAMRLAPRKRPRALVELVARAERLAGRGSLSLTILGEGPDRRRVESYLDTHGIGWVSLPGRVPRDELRERYAAADVYVSPSELESFGIAALEARTAGLPVVARAGSGVGEFVTHDVGGLIVPDDAVMAGALAGLAVDRGRVERMRRWNLDHSPEQDWPHVAALAVAEYERAIALTGKASHR